MFNLCLCIIGGCYYLNDYYLDFNVKLFEELDKEIIVGIIKYEFCYYYLYLIGRGYCYKDMDFKYFLKKIGGLCYVLVLMKK